MSTVQKFAGWFLGLVFVGSIWLFPALTPVAAKEKDQEPASSSTPRWWPKSPSPRSWAA